MLIMPADVVFTCLPAASAGPIGHHRVMSAAGIGTSTGETDVIAGNGVNAANAGNGVNAANAENGGSIAATEIIANIASGNEPRALPETAGPFS